jgi:7-carboxy-7-deazaguanine synthase
VKVSELFHSIQGEGKLLGTPSAFVRLSGCNLRCVWCFAPATRILRPDWSWTPIGELAVGDAVMGRTLPEAGRHGGLCETRVEHVSPRRAERVRVNGLLTCTPDHPFWLTGKGGARSGWRAVDRCLSLPVTFLAEPSPEIDDNYRRGYLSGMADGDGCFWTLKHRRGYRRFRLALSDAHLIRRFEEYAAAEGFRLDRGVHQANGFGGPAEWPALWLTRDEEARRFEALLAQGGDSSAWGWGYVGGILDAEGSLGGRYLRISQSPSANPATFGRIGRVLRRLAVDHAEEPTGYRINTSAGGLWRVLAEARPAKRSITSSIFGRAPNHCRRIERVERANPGEVITLKTGCGSYVAEGFVVKNCDTPYASWQPEGDERTAEQIVEYVEQTGTGHVVLTGGEPMIFPEFEALCEALRRGGRHLTVETAGTIFKPAAADLWSLSPKLANSTPVEREGGRFAVVHEKQRRRPGVLRQLRDHAAATGADHQFKFVVTSPDDLPEIEALLNEVGGVRAGDVMLMPEGTDEATLAGRCDWLVTLCLDRGYRLAPRLHVALFGNTRGT